MSFQWNQITAFLESNTVVLVLTAAAALLTCFFGYRLIRAWISLIGFCIGAFLGAFLVTRVSGSPVLIAVAAIALGILLALLANRVYLVGVFLLCGGVTYFLLSGLFPTGGGLFALYLLIAALVGVLSVNFVRPMVICSTAITGGLSGVSAVFVLCGVINQPLEVVLGVLVAVAGMVIQFSTTERRARRRR